MFITTAYDPAGARLQEGYRLGAIDYIYKPVPPAHSALEGRVLRRSVPQAWAQLTTMAAELERTRVQADLRHQALHDGLTGLLNRCALFEQTSRAHASRIRI